jgi:DNA-binding NarL/FixJ family response regulator
MARTPRDSSGIPGWDEPDASDSARRWMRDIAALVALPAMWADLTPAEIGTGLLSVLLGMLNLESAYARFEDAAGGPELECWRPIGSGLPAELAAVLDATPDGRLRAATETVPLERGGVVRVTSLPLKLPYGANYILAAARRDDFPTSIELHLLRVAASQAVISIHTARLLERERTARAAAESALQRQHAALAALSRELTAIVPLLSDRATELQSITAGFGQPEISGHRPVPVDGSSSSNGFEPSVRSMPLSHRLTRRETEVLGLLAQGLSNKEIAAVMWLSDRTVERHITSLYRKIGVARRSEATAFALRHDLAELDQTDSELRRTSRSS